MIVSGKDLVDYRGDDIIRSYKIERFIELPVITDIVLVGTSLKDTGILKKWEKWFTRKGEPWVVTQNKTKRGFIEEYTLWKRDIVLEERRNKQQLEEVP